MEHGACILATTLSDHETAAEKCEQDEEGYDGCSQYLYSKSLVFLVFLLFFVFSVFFLWVSFFLFSFLSLFLSFILSYYGDFESD